MHKIMLVDDHEVVREGIARLLNKEAMYDVIGSVGNCATMYERLKSIKPDLILLDLKLDDGDGVSAAIQLKKTHPKVKIIILSAYIEPLMAQEAKRVGVEGYLMKTIASRTLIETIDNVLNGQCVFDAAVEYTEYDDVPAALRKLSRREQQLMRQMCLGKTSKEIANAMNIAEKTVRNYTSRIYQKINVSSRSEAVAYYMRNRLMNEK